MTYFMSSGTPQNLNSVSQSICSSVMGKILLNSIFNINQSISYSLVPDLLRAVRKVQVLNTFLENISNTKYEILAVKSHFYLDHG